MVQREEPPNEEEIASIATSRLPTDSDVDDASVYSNSPSLRRHQMMARFPPPHPPPPLLDPPVNKSQLRKAGAISIAIFVGFIILCPALLLEIPSVSPPTARKAAAFGVFSVVNSTDDPAMLIVWSGMSHNRTLQNDTFIFHLESRKWQKHRYPPSSASSVLSSSSWRKQKKTQSWPRHSLTAEKEISLTFSPSDEEGAVVVGLPSQSSAQHPLPRWKAASASWNHPEGLLVLFGDAGLLDDDDDDNDKDGGDGGGGGRRNNKRALTRMKVGGEDRGNKKINVEEEEDEEESGDVRHVVRDDVWLLRTETMRWERGSAHGARVLGRRGHSVVTMNVEEVVGEPIVQQHRQRRQYALVFGGFAGDDGDGNDGNDGGDRGQNVNDVLLADVQWPWVNWSCVVVPESESTSVPDPRHGHTADQLLMDAKDDDDAGANATTTLNMVVFGGRDDVQFFNDIWVLRVDIVDEAGDMTAQWQRILPVDDSPLPCPRANHVSAVHNNHLYIWGGLSGPTFASAKPLDDLWAFSFASLRWSRAIMYGAKPLPRFLASYSAHVPSTTTTSINSNSNEKESGSASGVKALPPTASLLFIFGGETLDRCKMNDVWALNLDVLRWELLAPNFFAKKRCDVLFGGGRSGTRK